MKKTVTKKVVQPKKTNSKKKLFEDEEFELAQDEEAEEEPGLPEDIVPSDDQLNIEIEEPDDIPLEEVIADPGNEEDEDDELVARSSAAHSLIPPDLMDADFNDNDKEEDGDTLEESVTPAATRVRICPNCNEEVVEEATDIPLCPLCGFPLKQGVSAGEINDVDYDQVEFDDEQNYGANIAEITEDGDLYGGLPYQDDKY